MSANPKPSATMEKNGDGGRRRKRERSGEEAILVPSNEEKKTSRKNSQERKRRRVTSRSAEKMSSNLKMDQVDEERRKCLKKRQHNGNSSEEQKTEVKRAKQEPKTEDPRDSGDIGVRPTCSSISSNIRERLVYHHLLGAGGFGIVVLAEDSANHQKYAVKIIRKSFLNTEGEAANVMVERTVLRLASGSPFLVPAYFGFQTKMNIIFGLEYVSCGDFWNFILRKGPLEIDSARFYAAELVCGIQFLHLKGIIHRDLKPDNILVAATGHVKIADFGLALLNIFGDRAATGYAGTVGYVAPEILAGKEYGAGVDWYSFGVIINEMVTGESEFHPTLFKSSHSGVKNIIMQLLRKDPAQRLGVKENIRGHFFFRHIQWDSVEALRMPPPHIPEPTEPDPTAEGFTLEGMEADEASESPIPENLQAILGGFSFVT
ncbi:protein kinase C delta type-like [Dendropsophus ebraccatus]|uniref:protein kinase C delta type-like n=1 Tax=Dendropsophus ebraccatus TaxID=150705 RepID=UPI0038314A26